MPRRSDIKKVLIVGSGPIIIGQACEFDYSGAQACKALREEGYRVVLVNSNPATIMTDPEMADATYIEPITWRTVAKIIEKERPDALLPTLGGQTGLNLSVELAETGVHERYGVEMLGAHDPARQAFRRLEAEGMGLYSVEIWIQQPIPDPPALLAAARQSAQLARRLAAEPAVTASVGVHDLLEALDVEGLEEIVERAQLHRLDRRVYGAVSGHNNDRQL